MLKRGDKNPNHNRYAMKWECNSIDIKSEYLQGNTIQRKIFLKLPKEYDEGKLWRLKKIVYGLCDAVTAWK